MWICKYCKSKIEDNDTITCWNCGRDSGDPNYKEDNSKTMAPSRKVSHKIIRGVFKTWDELADIASEFMSTIPKDKIISVSHSEDKDDGVIIIFYEE